jgi:hypothetical protein
MAAAAIDLLRNFRLFIRDLIQTEISILLDAPKIDGGLGP